MKFNNNKEPKIGDIVKIKPIEFWEKLFDERNKIVIDGMTIRPGVRNNLAGKSFEIKSIEKTPINNNIRYHLIRVACAGWTKEMFDL